jgi:hypothetical protein
MRIKVKRKAKGNWHPQWQADIKDAAIWAAAQLGISSKDATVQFILKNNTEAQYSGVALTMDPFRRFVVILNAWAFPSSDKILSTIFHEMTHVAQEFHQGLAITDCLTEAHYDGMMYSFDGPDGFADAYYDLPWEVDARKSEKKLLERWKKSLTF